MSYFTNFFLKFLFLMTPFFVLSMFLSATQGWSIRHKRRLALRVGGAAFCASMLLLFFGEWIFRVFDITLDSFRIGGGSLLFLSAVGLVNNNVEDKKTAGMENENASESNISNIAVVPLAIPVMVGPGTIAALLVFSADAVTWSDRLLSVGALAMALLCVTAVLYLGTWIEEKFGRNVIVILSKVTGLILAAMASQMIFTGIHNFLK